ncbi:MAG: hypothetical protein QOJ00_96 [Actinomycetota bacterium]|jgi:hypothetical protein
MTEAHKAALAAGRSQSLAVKNYLEALETTKPKRGRKRTPETIQKQIADIDAQLDSAPVVTRLNLIQRRMDLVADQEALSGPGVDIDALEAEFVKVAAAYSKAKGITHAAWREIGVDPAVLKKAGIARS